MSIMTNDEVTKPKPNRKLGSNRVYNLNETANNKSNHKVYYFFH